MRRVRYQVAASLDGYIAGPGGEIDWIVSDPDIDFEALYRQFDMVVMGRKTYEEFLKAGNQGLPGMQVVVCSRTINQDDHPEITVVRDHVEESIRSYREKPGKDIWLFGGGLLFHALAAAGVIDTVEIAIMPVLLGEGIPLLPPPSQRLKLTLTGHKIYKSGIVLLEYDVEKSPGV
jgi:dihydrofolate reductase